MKMVNLEMVKMAQSFGVSGYLSIHERELCFGERMVDFVAYICGERQEPYKYETYASWWDHFKASVFPSWLLKKFPPKRQCHVVDVAILYPYLKTSLPKEKIGPYITVLVNNRTQQVWSEQPISKMDLFEKLSQEPMYDMTRKRCRACGTSFDTILGR